MISEYVRTASRITESDFSAARAAARAMYRDYAEHIVGCPNGCKRDASVSSSPPAGSGERWRVMDCRRCKAPSRRVKREHCDGVDGSPKDRWRCPEPGRCHVAAICNACDMQWAEMCPQHTLAA